jgi:hypothetical protein
MVGRLSLDHTICRERHARIHLLETLSMSGCKSSCYLVSISFLVHNRWMSLNGD